MHVLPFDVPVTDCHISIDEARCTTEAGKKKSKKQKSSAVAIDEEAAAFEAPAKKEKKVAMEAAREPEAAPSAGTVEGEKEAEAILSVPGEETEGGYTNGEAWKGGDLQERAPSSGRAFQRVKAEEWLDKKVRYSRDVLLCVVRW